ncbi:hypothetical protein HK102_007520, partial [Quaeritorhiza haematococci]
ELITFFTAIRDLEVRTAAEYAKVMKVFDVEDHFHGQTKESLNPIKACAQKFSEAHTSMEKFLGEYTLKELVELRGKVVQKSK